MAAGKRPGSDAELETLRGKVFELAVMMLGDRWSADDIAQETVARALEHLKDFRGESDFQSWAITIALNLCRAKLGGDGRRAAPVDPAVLDASRTNRRRGPLTSAMCHEDFERATVALKTLNRSLREVFILRYIHDLPYEGIARILGITPVAARLRSLRARKSLKDSFLWFFPPEVRKRLDEAIGLRP